jgi:hypothetical protein
MSLMRLALANGGGLIATAGDGRLSAPGVTASMRLRLAARIKAGLWLEIKHSGSHVGGESAH